MGKPYAITFNGDVSMDLTEDFRPFSETFRSVLSNLDGVKQFALSVWPFPENVSNMTELDARAFPDEFLQCAGTADSMTLEVRIEHDGIGRLFTVGRRRSPRADRSHEIRWANHSLRVRSGEVFQSEEAARIFLAYVRSGAVPEQFTLRAR